MSLTTIDTIDLLLQEMSRAMSDLFILNNSSFGLSKEIQATFFNSALITSLQINSIIDNYDYTLKVWADIDTQQLISFWSEAGIKLEFIISVGSKDSSSDEVLNSIAYTDYAISQTDQMLSLLYS